MYHNKIIYTPKIKLLVFLYFFISLSRIYFYWLQDTKKASSKKKIKSINNNSKGKISRIRMATKRAVIFNL